MSVRPEHLDAQENEAPWAYQGLEVRVREQGQLTAKVGSSHQVQVDHPSKYLVWIQITGWELIRLLIFLESRHCWLWDTRNPSNTSIPIWLRNKPQMDELWAGLGITV